MLKKDKKLLILGGTVLTCDIVKTAQSKGLYTIVTDWNKPDLSPAKLIADEYWNISLMDYDLLTEKIKEENINGIITGFTDSYLLPYQRLCEMNNLPCYATKEQFEWTTDKASFKTKCRKYDVPVVPEFDVNSFDKTIINQEHKVIIKPVDNSGSRGIFICDRPEEFEEKLRCSLDFSEKKQVVIERYMDCDDISLEYKIQDGEVTLSSICDRYIYKTQNEGSVTSILIYPSKYTDVYMEDVDKKVRRMFEGEGFKNGVLFMQAFVENGLFYFYEMGYRLSGGRHYIFTKNQNGDSAVEELINFAMTGNMSNQRIAGIANPCFKNICCQLSIICLSRKIVAIKGWEDIVRIPQIIDVSSVYKVGDTVGKQGTSASIFARLHIVVKNLEELNEIIEKVYSTLRVEDSSKNNLVIL